MKTHSRTALQSLTGLAFAAALAAAPVALQSPTATFSQTTAADFSISNVLIPDGQPTWGWAIYDGPFGGPPFPGETRAETAAFETVTPVGTTEKTTLVFRLEQQANFAPMHTIGRFRLSATTADRSTFADGLSTGGDVTTDWVVLTPVALRSEANSAFTPLDDGSILVSGPIPTVDTYTVRVHTSLTNITGFRLETLNDSGLPTSGPGRQPDNGNFVLTGFRVDAEDGWVFGPLVPAVVRLGAPLGTLTAPAVGTVSVNLEGHGIENSLQFSVEFPTNRLSFAGTTNFWAPGNLQIAVDSSLLGSGKVGVTASLPPGEAFPAGISSILGLQFATKPAVGTYTAELKFVDQPVTNRIVSTNGASRSTEWLGTTIGVDGALPQPVVAFQGLVSGKAGSVIEVPVTIVAAGIENAVSFSIGLSALSKITFVDATPSPGIPGAQLLINTNVIDTGRIGFAYALPAGATIPTGTNEFMRIKLLLSPTTTGRFTLSFGSNPIQRLVVDAAGTPLSVPWSAGAIESIPVPLEGDVHPVTAPDRNLSLSDWVQVGRFVAGLDTAANGRIFQSADSAPRQTGGNGNLTVADWVQAGRFSAGLDPAEPGAGPESPANPGPGRGTASPAGSTDRTLSISNVNAIPGRTAEALVSLTADGTENAVGFSVRFDAAVLSFAGTAAGSPDSGSIVNINTSRAAQGILGVALAKPAGAVFTKGENPLLRIRFTTSPTATNGTELTFGDSPVFREIANTAAQSLATLWTPATVSILRPSLAVESRTSQDGATLVLRWSAEFGAARLQTSPALAPGGNQAWVDAPGTPKLVGDRYEQELPTTDSTGFYRIQLQ